MTQDEIIRMAREATNNEPIYGRKEFTFSRNELERFAALVAAHEREKYKSMDEELAELYEMAVNQGKTIREYQNAVLAEREACAKVCDEIERHKWEILTQGGKLEGLSPRDCAAAIRARSE